MPDAAALETHDLSKHYGRLVALDRLNLTVRPGEVYGLIGPNGAGKTTLLRLVLGLARPTTGGVRILGEHAGTPAGLARIGSVVETPAFYPYLSGYDNLRVLGAYAGVGTDRIAPALERVGLADRGRDKVSGYSLGMRQRLGLAGALLRRPELLILDEPTNGLDPQGTREVRHLIASLAGDGATVFVSSHLLSEVEQICTHLGVMSDGRLVAQGTASAVRGVSAPRARVTTGQPQDAARTLTRLGVTDVVVGDGDVHGIPGSIAAEAIVAALVHDGVGVTAFAISSPSLEDLFVQLTGEGFDVSG